MMGIQKISCSSCDSEIIKRNVVNVLLNSENLAKLEITRVLPNTPKMIAMEQITVYGLTTVATVSSSELES